MKTIQKITYREIAQSDLLILEFLGLIFGNLGSLLELEEHLLAVLVERMIESQGVHAKTL